MKRANRETHATRQPTVQKEGSGVAARAVDTSTETHTHIEDACGTEHGWRKQHQEQRATPR
eukprot:m.31647 g.31647  ORF g.31647 m.31647 type:complete len:61 (+) comp12344_c0_seq2:170-352(+)